MSLYPKKNPLPFVLYPPQIFQNNIGGKILTQEVDIENNTSGSKSFVLYVSVPFCDKQCYSCPYFVSIIPKDITTVQKYVDCLVKDLERYAKYNKFKTSLLRAVYIGGGTGSILPNYMLKQILDCISQNFNCADDISITLEGNPRDFNDEKIDFIINDGRINRVSLGVQSFNPKILEILGSPHEGLEGENVIKKLMNKGIKQLNVDMIYNMPNHTIEDWQTDIKKLLDLNVKHFTIYVYRLHEGTAQKKRVESGKVSNPMDKDSQEVIDIHQEAIKAAEKAGFRMYMPNYFAKPGDEDQYNIWTFGEGSDTLGVGPGAYSYLNGMRLGTDKNVRAYIQDVENGQHRITMSSEKLPKRIQMERYVIQSLHFLRVDYQNFYEKFGVDFKEEFKDTIEIITRKGVVKDTGSQLAVTELGIEWVINVLLEFFNEIYWGDKKAKELPVWAMNVNMIDLVSVERAMWI